MEKEQKKKLYKLGLPIIMGTILLLGVSYAWLSLTLNGTKTNVLKAGTLSLTLTDAATNGINMQGVVPMLDEVGVTTSPYSFTLTNNGTVESEYTIYLDDVTLDAGETKLPDNVIKYNLVKDGTSQATALLSTIGSNPNRVLDSGVIKPNEIYSYDLRLWLDQDATIAISGQVFKGKIRVEAEQVKETLPEPTPEQCFDVDVDMGIIGYACTYAATQGGPLPEGVENEITDIIIPETINGTAITVIGPFAFQNNQLTSVVIPDSVTMIGEASFRNNQLTSVVIPSSVIGISNDAFSDNQLTSITIPNSVTWIMERAFQNNKLTNVTIPSSVTDIEYDAFQYNELTSVIIKGKSSTANFTVYPSYSPFGWADGYSDENITWQP